MTNRVIRIEADGGSRGNPGEAGSGTVILDHLTDTVLVELSKYIGVATNNVAEYLALVNGLEYCSVHFADAELVVHMDSKLVIEQMSGNWKIKHPDMQALAIQAQQLARGRSITYRWIPRELNFRADALANKAMDEAADVSRVVVDQTGAQASAPAQQAAPMAAVAEFNQSLPSSVRAPRIEPRPVTTIILVRHGRTHLTESKRISGRGGENPPLSAAGVADAQAAAKAIAQFSKAGPYAHLNKPDVVVASPIARTVETAEAIAKELGLSVSTDANLQEISFGDWDGLTNEQAMQRDPELFEAWRGSWTVSPPNGESLEEFDARVQLARECILSEHAGKTVVVVAHVMPIRGFIRAANDAGVAGYWRPQIAPCSISILRFWGNEAAEVVTVNSTSHLA